MRDLLLYPDGLVILILSAILFMTGYLIKKSTPTIKSVATTLFLASLLTVLSIVVSLKNQCGMEVCFYHGWPHFLYVSSQMPSFNVLKAFSLPEYFLANIVFYSSVEFLVWRVIQVKISSAS